MPFLFFHESWKRMTALSCWSKRVSRWLNSASYRTKIHELPSQCTCIEVLVIFNDHKTHNQPLHTLLRPKNCLTKIIEHHNYNCFHSASVLFLFYYYYLKCPPHQYYCINFFLTFASLALLTVRVRGSVMQHLARTSSPNVTTHSDSEDVTHMLLEQHQHNLKPWLQIFPISLNIYRNQMFRRSHPLNTCWISMATPRPFLFMQTLQRGLQQNITDHWNSKNIGNALIYMQSNSAGNITSTSACWVTGLAECSLLVPLYRETIHYTTYYRAFLSHFSRHGCYGQKMSHSYLPTSANSGWVWREYSSRSISQTNTSFFASQLYCRSRRVVVWPRALVRMTEFCPLPAVVWRHSLSNWIGCQIDEWAWNVHV